NRCRLNCDRHECPRIPIRRRGGARFGDRARRAQCSLSRSLRAVRKSRDAASIIRAIAAGSAAADLTKPGTKSEGASAYLAPSLNSWLLALCYFVAPSTG